MDTLRAGDLDLAIVFDFPQAGENRGQGLEVHHLLNDPFDAVVPADHRLAKGSEVAYADLAGEDWLLPDFGPDSPSMKTLTMVAVGEGISALPRLMLPRDHPGIRTRPFASGALIRRITAVRLPTRYLTPATERFLGLLAGAAREYDAAARL